MNDEIENMKEINSDVLINSKKDIDPIVMTFQITLCTFSTFVVTSDSPFSSDQHPWYGFHWSFSFVISYMLIIFLSSTYEFAASLKRKIKFVENFFLSFIVVIVLVLFNMLKQDGSPIKTDVRLFWGLVLVLKLLSIFGITVLVLNLLRVTLKYLFMVLSKIFKKLFCIKEKPHLIKAEVFEMAYEIINEIDSL